MDEDGNNKKMRGNRSRGKSRGRGAARGRSRGGRTKKAVRVIESDDEDTPQQQEKTAMDTSVAPETTNIQQTPNSENLQQEQPVQSEQQFDLEADISQLEAPTFTTINRGPPEPMLRLRWDHRVNLIGEKVLNPMIHCCDKCLKPILIYGRMIPCKHVFCLTCAKKEDKACSRCMEKVLRIEQTGLGTVFMCTHGGTRYGNAGCRRTYLSQRDLQAHINHRHVSNAAVAATPQTMSQPDTPQYSHPKPDSEPQLTKITPSAILTSRTKSVSSHVQSVMGNDPRVNSIASQQQLQQNSEHRQSQPHHHHHHHHHQQLGKESPYQQQQQQHHHHRSQNAAPMQNYTQSNSQTNQTMRTNLITVPIQETTMNAHDGHHSQQQGQQGHHYYTPQVSYGNYSVPPPASQSQQQSQPYFPSNQQQVNYPSVSQQQQQYVSSSQRQQSSAYLHEQYSSTPQQQQQTQQSQWNTHQPQFYR